MADELLTLSFDTDSKGGYVPCCPHCAITGAENFRYIEDIVNSRQIKEIKVEPIAGLVVLVLYAYYSTDGSEGENSRLLCTACGAESRIPEGVDLEFE